ncbi:hypothetical protein JI435_020370 [Parastagonospora nodorum SN15]|uniref:Uncharacterized protein n=1 Tax=Phaeosphaeria nodorum (strain SN15 / ATCC MYA-4574 / FGSC 10173) TaxID=321614 RepID=A0A7U2ES67_PHANO|nr:hypothetical protein JI435_020370 [Parastagonospora nodorum SN15]
MPLSATAFVVGLVVVGGPPISPTHTCTPACISLMTWSPTGHHA